MLSDDVFLDWRYAFGGTEAFSTCLRTLVERRTDTELAEGSQNVPAVHILKEQILCEGNCAFGVCFHKTQNIPPANHMAKHV